MGAAVGAIFPADRAASPGAAIFRVAVRSGAVTLFGAVEASVYKYPAIRPDTIAMPFGQGHTAYGQFAEGRGVNPNDLMGATFNEAGDLTFAGIKVKIEKTGKKSVLSRMEGKIGVYGFTKEK